MVSRSSITFGFGAKEFYDCETGTKMTVFYFSVLDFPEISFKSDSPEKSKEKKNVLKIIASFLHFGFSAGEFFGEKSVRKIRNLSHFLNF